MQAPRMRVGVIGDDLDERLPEQLHVAGHQVFYLDREDSPAVHDVEMVILSAGEASLPALVEMLEPDVRRGQIYLHTSLAHGVQVLDPLEIAGGVVIAAGRMSDERWAVTTVDDLGQTIAELVIGEIGGSVVNFTDDQRLHLATAIAYARAIAHLRDDAHQMLTSALGDPEDAFDIVHNAERFSRLPDIDGDAGLQAQWRTIHRPGQARSFRQTIRRAAEIQQSQDVELWAIQEEKL